VISVLIIQPAVLGIIKFLLFDPSLFSVVNREVKADSRAVAKMPVEIPWIARKESGIGKPVDFWFIFDVNCHLFVLYPDTVNFIMKVSR
jgi:hypothetical protein